MEVRYQVFVSSTYEDLKEERKEISKAILECECFPAGMELFPASSKKQWDVIKRVIDASDIYIVIIAGRYGSTTKDDNGHIISYTEMEFNYAMQQNKPIIALIHDSIGELPQKKAEKTQKGIKLLEAFKEKACDGRTVRFWNTAENLKSSALISLSNIKKDLLNESTEIGWIRANETCAKNDPTIIRLEKQISEYTSTIQSYEKKISNSDTELVSMRSEIKELKSHLKVYQNELDTLQNLYFSSNIIIGNDFTIPCNQSSLDFWKQFANFCANNSPDEIFLCDTMWNKRVQESFNKVDYVVSFIKDSATWSEITYKATESAKRFAQLSINKQYQYLKNSIVLWESLEPDGDAITFSNDNFILLFSKLFSLFYIYDIKNLDEHIKKVVTAKLYAALEQCIDFSNRLEGIEDCLSESDCF